jgi:PucR family transcriptional regulator, proline-responsive transcriptional activator
VILEILYNMVNKTYPLRLVAGAAGIRQQMTWFHILEDRAHSSFIRGNELVFTTGIAYNGEKWLIDFVIKLHEHKACGFVVNIGPYISNIPSQVIELCNQYYLPLFTVPWDVKLVDLTRHISELIIDSEKTIIQSASAFKGAIASSDASEYKAQLSEAGYLPATEFCIARLVAERTCSTDEIIRFIHNLSIQQGEDVVVFYLNSSIVVIYISLSNDKIKTSICSLYSALTYNYPLNRFFMGVSSNLQGIDNISIAYQQADLALIVAKIEAGSYMFYNETGIYRILFPIKDSKILKDYADDILGDILRYDQIHKTDYLKWLRLYIRYDGSVQRITKEMFCHRNTVNYKLKRIRDLFCLDTNSNMQKTRILIALHILDLEHIDK